MGPPLPVYFRIPDESTLTFRLGYLTLTFVHNLRFSQSQHGAVFVRHRLHNHYYFILEIKILWHLSSIKHFILNRQGAKWGRVGSQELGLSVSEEKPLSTKQRRWLLEVIFLKMGT